MNKIDTFLLILLGWTLVGVVFNFVTFQCKSKTMKTFMYILAGPIMCFLFFIPYAIDKVDKFFLKREK